MYELSDTIERKFVDSIALDDEWEIESDFGWVPITHIHKTIQYREWVIQTKNELTLTCADDHIVFDENFNEVFVKNLEPNKSQVMTKFGPSLVITVNESDVYSNMFDLTVDSENHRFYTNGILSHNTSTTVAYMLWSVLFNDSYNVAILANKGSLARDILSRVQLAFEYLPLWLQQGIVTWNKGNIELENGSKIIASGTSSSAIRGSSYNCISGDNLLDIKINDNVYRIRVDELTAIITNANSPKNIRIINKDTHEVFLGENHNVFEEQIRKVVFSNNNKISNYGADGYIRNTPYYTKVYAWIKHRVKFSSTSIKGTHTGSQAINKNGFSWQYAKEVIIRIYQNGVWATRKIVEYELFRTNVYANAVGSGAEGANDRSSMEMVTRRARTSSSLGEIESNITGNQRQNITSQHWKIDWSETFGGIQKENISKFARPQEICGVGEEYKQQPGENIKNGRETSWNEKNRRIQTKNERSQKGVYSLEQGEGGSFRGNKKENECISKGKDKEFWKSKSPMQIKTAEGFKGFDGIRISKNKKTICISLCNNTSIVCTPEHNIMTNDGWMQAQNVIDFLIMTEDGYHKVANISDHKDEETVYDILDVKDVHSFYANNILVKNCILLDEFAFVPSNMAHAFFTSTYPTISSGQTTKVIIVSTPNGMNNFYKMWMDAVEKRSLYKTLEVHWSEVPGRDEKWREETIRNTSEDQFRQEFESCDLTTLINTDTMQVSIGELYEQLKNENANP